MSIPIRFYTVLIRKSDVNKRYPGGAEGFHLDFPDAVEDHGLYGLVTMSGGELQEILDLLVSRHIDLASCGAIGEMFHGPIEPNPAIAFTRTADWPPAWEATLDGGG